VFELIWATSIPGTMRKRSGMLVAPERAISSGVITKIAAATSDSFCYFFETEVTSMFIRFSILTCVRSLGEVCETAGGCGDWPLTIWQSSKRHTTPAGIHNALTNRFDRFPPIAHTLSSPRTIRTLCASLKSEVVHQLVCNQRFLIRKCRWNLQGWLINGRVYRSGTVPLPISYY
jgi:hypothetical protein